MKEARPAGAAAVPSHETLIGDLLTMDLGGPSGAPVAAAAAAPAASAAASSSAGVDLLGGGLDALLSNGPAPGVAAPAAAAVPSVGAPASAPAASVGLLGDIFGLAAAPSTSYVPVLWFSQRILK